MQKEMTSFVNCDGKEVFFSDIEKFVIDTKICMISKIQIEFRLGYTPAAQAVEALAAKGVISEVNEEGYRNVLIK